MVTGRGGRITQGLSRDWDTPSSPQPEGGVRGTLCTNYSCPDSRRLSKGRGWGRGERPLPGGCQTPGPWPVDKQSSPSAQTRPPPPTPSPRRPSSPAKIASWLPRCFCSVRGQCFLVLDLLSTLDVTPQINSQRIPGGRCMQAAPQVLCLPFRGFLTRLTASEAELGKGCVQRGGARDTQVLAAEASAESGFSLVSSQWPSLTSAWP